MLESLGFEAEGLRTLLETGLFTSAGSQRARFVHRQIAEFLAGEKISTMPLFQARSVLSRDGGHASGIAGPLQEIAAWAASFNPEFAGWLAASDPELIGRSDVASDEPRRTAFSATVEMFKAGRLTEAQVHDDQALTSGFIYEGLEADIRSILVERTANTADAHSFAIKVIERNGLVGLAMDLARMALDPTLPLATRVRCGHAVSEIGNEASKGALKPLSLGLPEDAQDDLKGIALQLNWPWNMNDSELLRVLLPPKASNYMGPYKYFLWMMAQSAVALPQINLDVLKWASSVGKRGHHDDPLADIAGLIAYRALDLADQDEICMELSSRVIRAGSVGAAPFFLHKNGKELLTTNDTETIASRFEKDSQLRHSMLECIAKLAPSEMELFQAIRSVPALANLEDFGWLLQNAISGHSPAADSLAKMAAWLPWHTHNASFELLYRSKAEPVVVAHFPPLAVRLDSKEAETGRHFLSLMRESEEEQRGTQAIRREVVTGYLSKCPDDPHWFGALCRALAMDERGREGYARFILRTDGWAEAGAEDRAEIVKAAKRVVTDCTDLASRVEKEEYSTIPMDGVMEAFFLLAEVDLSFLKSLSNEIWEAWIWYVARETRYRLDQEPLEPKRALMRLAYDVQPDAIRGCKEITFTYSPSMHFS